MYWTLHQDVGSRLDRRRYFFASQFQQLLALTGVTLVVLTASGPASAQAGFFRMPGCRSYLNPDNMTRYDFSSGVCSGTVEALMSAGPALGICHPPDSTIDQGVRLVVQYVDRRAARLNENFTALAIEALRKAWPCSGSR